jgi:hypothetical protein
VSLGQLWTFLGFALPALAALLVPMPSIDLTYQLRAGAEILAGNGIPTVDSWTFTAAGTPWLDQQWGAQVLLAAVYQAAGWTGLALLRAGLVAISFGLLGATLRSIGCGARPASILTLLAFAVAAPALALRPQLFAIALFAATTWILVRRREHPRRLWLIPLIAVAWANLHGSFPLVIVLVALGWLDELTRRRSVAAPAGASASAAASAPAGASASAAVSGAAATTEPARVLGSTGIALIGAISALATLVTPFGIDTWRYVVALASNPAVSGRVSEWRPPSPLDPAGAIFYVSLLTALAVVALRWRADGGLRKDRFAPVATILAFGALGVVTGRGLAWWALAMPVAAANLAHEGGLTAQLPERLRGAGALFRDAAPRRSTRGNRLNGVVAAVLILAGVALLPLWRPLGAAGVPQATLTYAPQGIAAFLRDRGGSDGDNAAIWAPQAWGSWLEFAVPEALVSMDSRIELFPASLLDDADSVASATGDWRGILERRGAHLLVVPSDAVELRTRLGESKLVPLYEDADGSVWLAVVPPGA